MGLADKYKKLSDDKLAADKFSQLVLESAANELLAKDIIDDIPHKIESAIIKGDRHITIDADHFQGDDDKPVWDGSGKIIFDWANKEGFVVDYISEKFGYGVRNFKMLIMW